MRLLLLLRLVLSSGIEKISRRLSTNKALGKFDRHVRDCAEVRVPAAARISLQKPFARKRGSTGPLYECFEVAGWVLSCSRLSVTISRVEQKR